MAETDNFAGEDQYTQAFRERGAVAAFGLAADDARKLRELLRRLAPAARTAHVRLCVLSMDLPLEESDAAKLLVVARELGEAIEHAGTPFGEAISAVRAAHDAGLAAGRMQAVTERGAN